MASAARWARALALCKALRDKYDIAAVTNDIYTEEDAQSKSDLLVINKIDLAPMVGASLEVMERDAKRMRGERPFVFTNMKTRQGLDTVIRFIETEGLLAGAAALKDTLTADKARREDSVQ